jgi:glycosyltransferase involved in cell wall biosynthesis
MNKSQPPPNPSSLEGSKKIWIFNHYAITQYANKTGRHYWFAWYLKDKGFEPIVFSSNFNNTIHIPIQEGKYHIEEVDLIPFVFVKTISVFSNNVKRVFNILLFYWNLLFVSKRIMERYGKPDIILASSFHPFTLVAGLQIGKRLGIPVICEVRDLWPEALFFVKKGLKKNIFGKLMLWCEYWIYKRANALVFTQEGGVDYIKENKWDKGNGGSIDMERVFYINNGVDVEGFNALMNERTIDDADLHTDDFRVVYVGAINPLNNVDMIIYAANLLKVHDKIKFLVYGDSKQVAVFKKKAEDLRLKNIVFKGRIDNQYVPYVLSKSSVNILIWNPAKWNVVRGYSSNKLFEYMASGKPIISTIKMGYSIIDKYKCGIEIEDATAEKLAEMILAMRDMSKEEYDRFGENGKMGAEDFDYRILAEKLFNVVLEIGNL